MQNFKMSLNTLRIIAMSLMLGILITLFAVAPIEFTLLGIIILIGFFLIMAEIGTASSYTIAIGKMLEQLFKPKPIPKGKTGLDKATNSTINNVGGARVTKQEEESGQPLTNGEVVIGEIKPIHKGDTNKG